MEDYLNKQLENPYLLKNLEINSQVKEEDIYKLAKLWLEKYQLSLEENLLTTTGESVKINSLETFNEVFLEDLVEKSDLEKGQVEFLTSRFYKMIPSNFNNKEEMSLYNKFIYRLFNRYDGRRLKTINSFVKIMPYIMPKRNDAHVFSKIKINTDTINDYILEKKDQGFRISYLHLFTAAFVRTIAQRPQLNRFIMNNRIYARDDIFVSLAVKKTLRDTGDETTLKFQFTGRENIFQVSEIINSMIKEVGVTDEPTMADKLADMFMSLPNIIVKPLIGLVKFSDRINLMPGKIVDVSPFHTTIFFTYLKSIKTDYAYHHLYNFGNTGLFAALGKEKKIPVVEEDEIVIQRICELGVALDERICDGLYFSNSLKMFRRYLENPYLLEENLKDIVEDVL